MKIFFSFFYILSFFSLAGTTVFAKDFTNVVPDDLDTAQVNRLNQLGFSNRLVDPDQTLVYAEKALTLAKKLNYSDGIAEAYRVKGIAKFYQNQIDSAVFWYYNSLSYFKQSGNKAGIAKVYNNIGGIYREIDNDKALENYQESLNLALSLDMKDLVAGLYLNIGIIYQKKHQLETALGNYQKSNALFVHLGNSTGIASCLQSISSIYKDRKEWQKAEKYALGAIEKAKQNDLNYIIASTNLTLSLVYIAENRYLEAEKAIDEGMAYSSLLKNEKIEHDYTYRSYQLYSKQKNYEKALKYLAQVYKLDSARNQNYESGKIRMLQEQINRQEKEGEIQVLKEREKGNQILFWATVLVLGLLVMIIALLVKNVSKKAQTNKQLTALNQEISLQKENLDRVNHNLEEIIDERTLDLKVKNKKLSEYSSHLSHQIRGPVATLKGLMNLNKEGLIEKEEVIQQIEKCVNDIDDKILRINDMLHDPTQNGFSAAPIKDADPTLLK